VSRSGRCLIAEEYLVVWVDGRLVGWLAGGRGNPKPDRGKMNYDLTVGI